MFGTSGMASSFASPPGGGGGYTSPQHSVTAMGSAIMSPSTSGLGVGLTPVAGTGGSPVFQSPSSNKFPAGGGAIIFTPHSNASPLGGAAVTSPTSPYSYVGGSASSFVQSPPTGLGSSGIVYSPPPYSSTHVYSMGSIPGHPGMASPITHGYGPPTQYTNTQPYGYGSRVMAGMHSYHQAPYQHHYQASPYYGHHSPRDEIVEPMHCSPIGQPHAAAGSPQYQQHMRSPGNNPPRPQHLPAFLTGVDLMAAVSPRPRRVFDRSPSTSPPVAGASGGRSPQSKSPNWAGQQDGAQPGAQGYSGHGQADPSGGGLYRKRVQGQGPSRQLRFNESQSVQQATEEKEKAKRSGPPIHGFGSSEEITNFLSSPLLNESQQIVPGAAITREAVLKYGNSPPIAESNWVTVFGFPAAAASFIYTNFAQYGSIVQSKCNPGGNWLHIQYASRIDARKALACNGKVLGGSIMVGVISSPREVIEMYERPNRETIQNPGPSNSSTSPPSLPSSLKAPLQERNSGSSNTPDASSKPRNIRPLAGSNLTSPVMGGTDRSSYGSYGSSSINKESSYLSPGTGQNENVPLPTASTGMLTKAMEYMFGW